MKRLISKPAVICRVFVGFRVSGSGKKASCHSFLRRSPPGRSGISATRHAVGASRCATDRRGADVGLEDAAFES